MNTHRLSPIAGTKSEFFLPIGMNVRPKAGHEIRHDIAEKVGEIGEHLRAQMPQPAASTNGPSAWTSGTKEIAMSLLLLIVLLLIVFGGLPNWGYHQYGYRPSGIGGIVLIIVLIMFLTGRLNF
jgi:hypothetical protein